MPDHLHLFAASGLLDVGFDAWVRYWKSMYSRRHALAHERWQANHWDYRLRNDGEYEEKWEYVRSNPVRHGLVPRAEDWPFAGDLNGSDW